MKLVAIYVIIYVVRTNVWFFLCIWKKKNFILIWENHVQYANRGQSFQVVTITLLKHSYENCPSPFKSSKGGGDHGSYGIIADQLFKDI